MVGKREGTDMKTFVSNTTGIIAIAALFGLVALLVAYGILNFGGFTAFVIGLIVALITAIALWMGWGDIAAEGASTPSAPTPPPAPVAQPAPRVADPVTPKPETPVAEASKPAQPPVTPAPAAKKGASSPKPTTPSATPKKKPAAKPKAAAKTPATPAVKAAPKRAPVAPDGKPELLAQPRGGEGDDLKQIKGVGPKMETLLNSMGVWHFDQVAGWRKKEVEWVDANLKGFKGRVSRDEWVKQAKVLAKGGSTEFSSKVKKGGVY